MKRLISLIRGDILFQFKYGFYFLYIAMTILYLIVINIFPVLLRAKVGIVMIYTDPSAMGLFFMGSIVLFEKSERVLDSISVSPVRPWQYVFSKLFSIALISVAVGYAIGAAAGSITRPVLFGAGVLLLSFASSAVGLIIACKIKTLNQFLLCTVPVEIVMNVPVLLWLLGIKKDWFLIHPGVSMIQLCTGAAEWLPALVSLIVWTVLLTGLSCRVVRKMLQSLGGMKL